MDGVKHDAMLILLPQKSIWDFRAKLIEDPLTENHVQVISSRSHSVVSDHGTINTLWQSSSTLLDSV